MAGTIYSAQIELFDFARMARAMKILRWRWAGAKERTPSEAELIAEANHLLRSARINAEANPNKDCAVSSGGLVAHGTGRIDFEAIGTSREKALDAWIKAQR